jgi:hypothetical protein
MITLVYFIKHINWVMTSVVVLKRLINVRALKKKNEMLISFGFLAPKVLKLFGFQKLWL